VTAKRGEIIELRAVNPDGDLACDFTIADEQARAGLREELEAAMVPPVRPIDDGVEVRFRREGMAAVQRYIDLESRCCSFLTLSVERTEDAVILRVTGRPEARPVIESIFSTSAERPASKD
jgi:hypothetical protein